MLQPILSWDSPEIQTMTRGYYAKRFNILIIVLVTFYLSLSTYNTFFKDMGIREDGCAGVTGADPRLHLAKGWGMEISKRLATLRNHCSRDRSLLYNPSVGSHILVNTNSSLAMCFVPKTGCTFWKRVIYKLQTSKGKQIAQLFDIGKGKIHSMPINKIGTISSHQELFNFWKRSTKIVFARDPYSRLFSAYVDKFFLPDFWGAGLYVKRRVYTGTEVRTCGHDVSFEEFLRYVIKAEKSEKYYHQFVDDHWQPVSRLCQPCDMDYNVVAKQETFSADRDWILQSLGLTEIFPQADNISREDTAKDAMNQTIDSYFRAALVQSPCVTQLELVQRFWRSFQIQGYLPSSLELPKDELTHVVGDLKEPFRLMAMRMYDAHKMSRADYKEQRRNEMKSAYKNIPLELMERIQHFFRKDFEMFSYDIRPDYLYADRQ